MSVKKITTAFDLAIKDYTEINWGFQSNLKAKAEARQPKNMHDTNYLSKLLDFLENPEGGYNLKSLKYLVVSHLTGEKASSDESAELMIKKIMHLIKYDYLQQNITDQSNKFKLFSFFAKPVIPKELVQNIADLFHEAEEAAIKKPK